MVLYCTTHYITVQYSTVQYSTVQYSVIIFPCRLSISFSISQLLISPWRWKYVVSPTLLPTLRIHAERVHEFVPAAVYFMNSRRQKKVPIYRPYYGTGNPIPFPFNFRPVAVQSPFIFNPFYGQPVRSINQVNSLGSARN